MHRKNRTQRRRAHLHTRLGHSPDTQKSRRAPPDAGAALVGISHTYYRHPPDRASYNVRVRARSSGYIFSSSMCVFCFVCDANGTRRMAFCGYHGYGYGYGYG